ncbi:MAG: exo-alpha-sialidase [Calditrichaeota bacterium]|nr:exo-alpha-sialidase [Calditrichota bacterium]
MKHLKQIGVVIFILFLWVMGLFAQEGPAWLPMGDLYQAEKIWTFLEIPNTSIVLAGGRYGGEGMGIWKSTDGGQTWSLKLKKYYTKEGVRQLIFDDKKNIIFACISNISRDYKDLPWKSLWYSDDLGETWNYIYHPTNLGAQAGIHGMALIDNKLYVAFEENRTENGNDWWIYSAMLYRLDISDHDPDNWYWEFVMQYPDLNYIMRLTENNGKLYVFGKDYNRDAIRIFIHDVQMLNTSSVTLGTISKIASQVQSLENLQAKNEEMQSAPKHSKNVSPTNWR